MDCLNKITYLYMLLFSLGNSTEQIENPFKYKYNVDK